MIKKAQNIMDKEKTNEESRKLQAEESLPGVAVNVSDDGKVDPKLVKERTSTLDNNPRNDDGPNPQK